MAKKTALILSGGGAKGAFQCGAEKYAREARGYHWDIIAGVSVGALNAVMLAMEKYQRLFEIWNTISNDQVFTGGFNLISAFKVLFLRQKSFYGNEPLRQMLHAEFEPEKLRVDLRVGTVSLVTGNYIQFRPGDAHLDKAVLASTVMPIIWSPVEISPDLQNMVDGGVRNISPLGDVLDAEPDEIIVINCNRQAANPLPVAPKNVVEIGQRTLDLLLNELFISDLREFLRINALVKQAADQDVILVNPSTGMPFKYYECKIIEPVEPLGDTLDFSQVHVQRSLRLGAERAKQILG
jgi:NTE family protein